MNFELPLSSVFLDCSSSHHIYNQGAYSGNSIKCMNTSHLVKAESLIFLFIIRQGELKSTEQLK